ncbi:MAG: hypothetical protein ABI945_03100 [Nitrospirales bacterium]
MTRQGMQVVVFCLVLSGVAHGASTDECPLAFEHGHMKFPVDQLTSESRCLLADVIDHPGASGVIGPNRTPISVELYAYLLDHPAVSAMLMERMGMGSFQITPQGPNRYWVNDRDGAEGLLVLVFRDVHTRIYYIDGRHRSALFPTMRAKTAVFLRIMTEPAASGRSLVQTTLASYTRFEDGMLSRLLRLFQPLVTRAVNRTLTKEFSLTHRLGILIAEQPQRVLREAAGLSEATSDDRQSLLALLRTEAASSDPADIPQ